MKKVFISGPMTGLPAYNFPKFNLVAQQLRDKGYDVVNPVDICKKYSVEKVTSDQKVFDQMIQDQLHALAQCDMIYFLEGWEHSVGAQREYKYARIYGLKFRYENCSWWMQLFYRLRNWAYDYEIH